MHLWVRRKTVVCLILVVIGQIPGRRDMLQGLVLGPSWCGLKSEEIKESIRSVVVSVDVQKSGTRHVLYDGA